MRNRLTGNVWRSLRRYVVASALLGLLATSIMVAPASATYTPGRLGPAARVSIYTNDDGVVRADDVTDVGDISSAYDVWGTTSSGDPTEAGMDAARLDYDVARCAASSTDRSGVRLEINAAYPGYVCSFTVVIVKRAVSGFILDGVSVVSDTGLELVQIDAWTSRDGPKHPRYAFYTYAVTITDEAPPDDTLLFEVDLTAAVHGPPKCLPPSWR